MIRETILTAITWVAVLVMFAYIGVKLADQFQPEAVFDIRIRPTYTDTAFEDLMIEKIYYEKAYKELDGMLGE